MSKVFHADDNVHARVKEFCEKNGLKSKMWVGDIVSWAVDNEIVDALNDDTLRSKLKSVPVKKKTKSSIVTDRYSIEQAPWEEKPFWEEKDCAS